MGSILLEDIMHCYNKSIYISIHKKLVFRYGQSVTSERQRDNYCVDIPVHSSITLSANCPHCPALPHHAPATILARSRHSSHDTSHLVQMILGIRN